MVVPRRGARRLREPLLVTVRAEEVRVRAVVHLETGTCRLPRARGNDVAERLDVPGTVRVEVLQETRLGPVHESVHPDFQAAVRAEGVDVAVHTASDRSLRITVADDGHGIGAANTGVGLASMRRRAETLGGSLHIETTATGTSITATLPLEQP